MNRSFKKARFVNVNVINPNSSIAEFEQILLSNSGEDAFELAIKLLSAKLMDEINIMDGDEEKFIIHQTASKTYFEVSNLYSHAIIKWPQLSNGTSDELGITPEHLIRTIKPLLGWRLKDSDLSWLDATLEKLVARDSKGALGQYFTPREIVRLCVEVLNPSPNDLLMDPACGSGGFIFESSKWSRHKYRNVPNSLGIDFSQKSVKVATLLAAATHESKIKISKANSLDGRSYVSSFPLEWQDFLLQESASKTKRATTWGAWNQLGCNILFTNPPFAGDIDDYDLLDAFESQQNQLTKKAVSREHLFIERAVDLLMPSGRMAIVVPQGILSNSTSLYLRLWLFKKCRILGVIGLHQHAFLPYTGVKTAILFLAKPALGEPLPKDYEVFIAISKLCGKDSSGKNVGMSDYDHVRDVFKQFLHDQKFIWADESDALENQNILVEKVKFSEIEVTGRLDPEYYDPEARYLNKMLSAYSSKTISDVVCSRVPRFKKKDYMDITYLDISSIDSRTGLAFPHVISAEEAPSRASYIVEKGDVLVSTVRPDRNVVAIVTDNYDAPAVASSGFCVLRSSIAPAELLFAYCKTNAFKKILAMHATSSMYPTVNDKDILGIPFIEPTKDVENEVVELIRSGLDMLEKAQAKIRDAVTIMDDYMENVIE